MAFSAKALAWLLCAPMAMAQDYASFWQSTRSALDKEPLEATEKDAREPLPYKTFDIEYRSLGGVRVRARLALPIRGGTSAGPLPAIVTAPGYGGLQQGVMLDECQRGYAVLQGFPRSVPGEKLVYGIEKPEGAYYQLAYADVMRGIDYLVSRKDIDAQRIGIAGTSQGGGIALAVASIDTRIKVVAAHVPFLCDMRRGAHRRIADQTNTGQGRGQRRAPSPHDRFLRPATVGPLIASSSHRQFRPRRRSVSGWNHPRGI